MSIPESQNQFRRASDKFVVFLQRNIIYFALIGLFYLDLELIWRAMFFNINDFTKAFSYWSLTGFTSLWIFFVGGGAGFFLGLFNEHKWINEKLNIFWQSVIGSVLVLIIEFLAGLVLNVAFGLNLWDYSKFPLNIMGQICLLYGILWILICPLVFWVDDALRHYIDRKPLPYGLIEIYKELFKLWWGKPFI